MVLGVQCLGKKAQAVYFHQRLLNGRHGPVSQPFRDVAHAPTGRRTTSQPVPEHCKHQLYHLGAGLSVIVPLPLHSLQGSRRVMNWFTEPPRASRPE